MFKRIGKLDKYSGKFGDGWKKMDREKTDSVREFGMIALQAVLHGAIVGILIGLWLGF
jgi:hypothetical protein